MSENQVTAAELAEALRSVIDVVSEYLCDDCGLNESKQLENALATLDRYDAHQNEEPVCTGLSAVWCPRCGDCTCDLNVYGERDLCTSSCRLHGTPMVSRHAESERYGAQQKRKVELCEWNPIHGVPAKSDLPYNCQNEATWSVGRGKRTLHLCDKCAASPDFKRLKRRVRLKEGVWIAEEADPVRTEIEAAAVNVVSAHEKVIRSKHGSETRNWNRTGRSKAIEALRDALRKRGAL